MLAIHHRPGSFSDNWIKYCEQNSIPYKLVDCYSSEIVQDLQKCDVLLWHWAHYDSKAVLFARQLIYSLEMIGKKVFPSYKTCWHFDDKIGQKYLLESLGAPLVPSHIFYNKKRALEWARYTTYPKVFKLRGGASSENVRIVKNYSTAKKLIQCAFSRGFKAKSRFRFLEERMWHFRRDKNISSFLNISKGVARLFIPKQAELQLPIQKNYVYFQDFISQNDHDIRVIVIGMRAFAIKRMVRDGDFRASGSGKIIYNPDEIPGQCIKLAFELSRKLGSQCLACDFVFDENIPLLVEISYGFAQKGYLTCPGHWNENLEWIEGPFHPENFMLEDILN